ncbi:MAG: hypothetical protein Q9164_004322 [Protoblastenia rupestris]
MPGPRLEVQVAAWSYGVRASEGVSSFARDDLGVLEVMICGKKLAKRRGRYALNVEAEATCYALAGGNYSLHDILVVYLLAGIKAVSQICLVEGRNFDLASAEVESVVFDHGKGRGHVYQAAPYSCLLLSLRTVDFSIDVCLKLERTALCMVGEYDGHGVVIESHDSRIVDFHFGLRGDRTLLQAHDRRRVF